MVLPRFSWRAVLGASIALLPLALIVRVWLAVLFNP